MFEKTYPAIYYILIGQRAEYANKKDCEVWGMSKGKKRLQYFSIIMQIVLQAVLLFPWMNLGTWKCNVPWYLIKMLRSGKGLGYVKSSLKPLGALEGLDNQMVVQVLILFVAELVLVLLIQLLGLVNLFFSLKNRHKLMPDVIALIAGCMISYLGADGAVFTDPVSQVYPFVMVMLLVINLIAAKALDSWEEQKEMQEAVKAKEKAYKEEKERRLGFHGKYPEGFYRVIWKNFKKSKKDFIVYAGMNLLPAGLIFAGVGMAQMLAPFNKEGNILTGHGITAILLEFLIVSLIASLMLMIANLLSYFRKRMRNYSIFTSMGMRKSTLYALLGAEIGAGIVSMLVGGGCIGGVILFILRRIFLSKSGMGEEPAKVTAFSYLIASLILIGISVIGLMIIRDFFLYRELRKIQLGDVEKEKMPEKRVPLWLAVGIILTLIALWRFGMRTKAEGIKIILLLFAGIYLVEKFGFALFLKLRKNKRTYYEKLMPYNTFYYRFKSTFRYVYVISIIPVLVLFVFGKGMISAKIAEKPETLFPYDFVCMATEEDETFWNQLKETYDIKLQEYPMVRVTNVDNSEKMDDIRKVIMPQGQHIGISESTYKKLCAAAGKKAENLNLSADGKDVYIIYQQAKSVKAHPLDYMNSRKNPYLHIGQPLQSYWYLDREKLYPKRTVTGETIDVLTGAFRQGSEENLVVFSDEYFENVQDDWKKYNWITGDPVQKEEAVEGVGIHHWPTRLVLLNVKNADYEAVEKDLQAFRKAHEVDEKFDQDVLSCYAKRTSIEQMKSERFMTTVVDIFIMGAFLLGSILVIYLKYESEMKDKKRRNEFLTCIGMRTKERIQVIRTETRIFFWVPVAVLLVTVPVLTAEMWKMRQYTGVDCGKYAKYLLILTGIYLVLQGIGVKVIEWHTIRKVEGKHERNLKGK